MGIIGIVAALTIPALIEQNNIHIVETQLKKFYTTMNDAVKFAEAEYGDKTWWYEDLSGPLTDEDGNEIEGTSKQAEWFDRYLLPYLKVLKTEIRNNSPIYYLADGTAFYMTSETSRDWCVYITDPDKCLSKYSSNISDANGSCRFLFSYRPNSTTSYWKYHYGRGPEPYKFNWDGKEDTLRNDSTYGCSSGNGAYCTALIQYHGWKIPDDYPRKIYR